MYRCHFCKAVAQASSPAHRVVVETRAAEYPSRAKAHSMRVGRKQKTFDDPGGAGYEIAKEVLACKTCADAFEPPVPTEEDVPATYSV